MTAVGIGRTDRERGKYRARPTFGIDNFDASVVGGDGAQVLAANLAGLARAQGTKFDTASRFIDECVSQPARP